MSPPKSTCWARSRRSSDAVTTTYRCRAACYSDDTSLTCVGQTAGMTTMHRDSDTVNATLAWLGYYVRILLDLLRCDLNHLQHQKMEKFSLQDSCLIQYYHNSCYITWPTVHFTPKLDHGYVASYLRISQVSKGTVVLKLQQHPCFDFS